MKYANIYKVKRLNGDIHLIAKSCGCMPDEHIEQLKTMAKKEFGDFIIEHSGDVMKNESYAIAKKAPEGAKE